MEDEKKGGDEPQVTNQLRKDWNDYVAYLDRKGLKGKPELDKNNFGFKVLEDYRKENPETTITKETIPVIQKEFSNYRDYSLSKIKAGKAGFAPGVTEENYMRALSIVDGIPGQRTTSYSFPLEYMKTLENGQVTQIENKGFSTVNKP